MVDFPTCPDEWLRRGREHLDVGRDRPAESALRRALAGFRQADDVSGQAECWFLLGVAHRRTGRTEQAEAAWQATLDGLHKAGAEDGDVALCHAELGALYADSDRLEDAEAALGTALALWQEVEGPAGLVDEVRARYGRVLLALGRLEDAREMLRSALPGFEERVEWSSVACCRWDLGRVERQAGHLDGALGHFRAASDAFSRAEDLAGVADCGYQRGSVQLERGRYSAAEEAFRRALAVWQEHEGQEWNTARCHHSLGLLYARTGRVDASKEELREAAAGYDRLGAVIEAAWARSDWARLLARQSQVRAAAGLILPAVLVLDTHRFALPCEQRGVWSRRMGPIVAAAQRIVAAVGDPDTVQRIITRTRVEQLFDRDLKDADRQAARFLDLALLDAAHAGVADREGVSGCGW